MLTEFPVEAYWKPEQERWLYKLPCELVQDGDVVSRTPWGEQWFVTTVTRVFWWYWLGYGLGLVRGDVYVDAMLSPDPRPHAHRGYRIYDL